MPAARSFRKFLAATVIACSTLAVATLPASAAIQHDAIVSCSNSTTGSVIPAREPVTASGARQWSYSIYYIGDYRNPWVTSNWTAAYANAGYAPTYEFVNGSWATLTPAGIDFQLPPHYGQATVWELRYELVNGRWSTQWVYAGGCAAPPSN